ncbi:MAG: hypothetical protein ACYSU1_04825 [Planctomycetota bacterium]|jgi:hypothetical protein
MTNQEKSFLPIGRTLIVALLLAGAGTAVMQWSENGQLPELPADPLAHPVQLVAVHPFTLDRPYTHWYRSDRPEVDAGMLVVLKVDELELLHPRQTAQPVLQFGAQTAEPMNAGHLSGYVVALVPAARIADGEVDLDLTTTPIFYGEPALAETLDQAALDARLKDALASGVLAPTEETVGAAMLDSLHFANDHALRMWAADMIATWSPQEMDLVEGMRVPLVGQ